MEDTLRTRRLPHTLAPVLLSDALGEEQDGEEWLVENVLARGSLALVYGKSHVGKTRLLVHQMFRLCRGEMTFGHRVPAGEDRPFVLYWPSEGTRAGFRRLAGQMMIRTASPWDDETFRNAHAYTVSEGARKTGLLDEARPVWFWMPPRGLSTPSFKSPEFRDVVTKPRANVVVLDTYGRFPGCEDENSSSDLRENVVIPLKAISDAHGTTFILVHHPGKNGEGPRGTGALTGDFDTVLRVDRLPDVKDGQSIADGTRHRLKVTFEKVRDSAEPEPLLYRTNLDGRFHILSGNYGVSAGQVHAGEKVQGHVLDPKITEALGQAGEPQTTGSVENAVPAKNGAVSKRLHALHEQGTVTMEERGPAKLWSLSE